MDKDTFLQLFLETVHNVRNPYHPLVWINGEPEIGEGTYIGGFSEINAKGAFVRIGKFCDIASFVAINCADSHRKAIGISDKPDLRDIYIGDQVFIGSHSVILGGAEIGSHSVIAAGTVVRAAKIAPFSLVIGNPMVVKEGYYRTEYEAQHGPYDGQHSS